MSKNADTAQAILTRVGGKANVVNAYHCMTRLRLTLKDNSKVEQEALKKLPGVMGLYDNNGEIQVILGPAVDNIYEEFVKISGVHHEDAIPENEDPELTEKPKITPKSILKGILNAFSASISPLIPLFVVIGMANVVAAIIGPTLLNLVSDTDPLYTNFYYIGQAILYFLPILLAMTSSKFFGTNRFISVALACIMLYPDMLTAIAGETGYTVYGITAPNVTYSGQIIPILLVVWVQSYVEKFLNKFVPNALKVLLVPFGTVAIMLPLEMCFLGPLGFNIGALLCGAVLGLYQVAGPVETTIVCAVVPFLTAFGVSRPIFFACLTTLMTTGVEFAYMPIAMVINNFIVMGCCTGYLIKTKSKEQKQYAITSLVANALGGVSEPTLFGIILPNPKTFLPIIIGGAVSGLYLGIMKVGYYSFGPSNVLSVIGFVSAENSANFINGCIAAALAFVVTLVAMLVLYKDKDEAPKGK